MTSKKAVVDDWDKEITPVESPPDPRTVRVKCTTTRKPWPYDKALEMGEEIMVEPELAEKLVKLGFVEIMK